MPSGVYVHKSQPLLERLMRHVQPEPNSGCLLWTGAKYKNGYGHVYFGLVDGKKTWMSAARAMWTAVKGPLPRHLEPDHTCRVRLCVNVAHLEPVTHAENRRRSRGYRHADIFKITNCKRGHQNWRSTPDGKRRVCRVCQRGHVKKHRDQLKGAAI